MGRGGTGSRCSAGLEQAGDDGQGDERSDQARDGLLTRSRSTRKRVGDRHRTDGHDGIDEMEDLARATAADEQAESARQRHDQREDEEHLEALGGNARGRAPPRTPGSLETPSSDLFSPSLVLSLYERLTHGVDVKGIARGQRRTNLAGTINPEEMAEVARQRGILAEICDFANAGSGDPEEPSAIKAYMVLSAMGYWRPLPDLNETVGRHMLRLFAVKRDYPVLGYLATSRSMLRWFDGKLRPGVTRFAELKRREVIPGTIDGTEDILTYLQLTTDAIGGLLGYIDLTKKQDAALAAALESEERLNYRQRSVLGRALSRPTTEFRIRAHQNAHHVVYQTARADLLDLEERGFLVREMHGKAFVFVPAPNLEQLLSHGG
jgi:Fic family protein